MDLTKCRRALIKFITEKREEELREARRQKAVEEAMRKKEEERRQKEERAARAKKQKLLFSHALRKVGRSQAYKDELQRCKRVYLRRWYQHVQNIKRYKDVEERRKVIEQYSSFLAQCGDIKPIKDLGGVPDNVEIAEVTEATETPYLDYKQLNISPKQKMVLLLINPSEPSGFSKKVNMCISNHFDNLSHHPQVHLRKESSIKSILKCNFSAAVLITHDFEEVVAAAQLLGKKKDECQYV